MFIGAILDDAWKGGEHRVAKLLASSLRREGHEVSEIHIKHDEKSRSATRSITRKIDFLVEPSIDHSITEHYSEEIKAHMPDITVSWYDIDLSAFWASTLVGLPTVVQTMIFWPICPKTDLFNTHTKKGCAGPNICCGSCISKNKQHLRNLTFSLASMYKINQYKNRLKMARAIVSDSKYLKKELIRFRYPASNIRVIYNGIDLNTIKATAPNLSEKMVLFLAENDEKKGTDHFIKLSKKLKPSFPDVRFVWVGQKEVSGESFETYDYIWDEKKLGELYNEAYIIIHPALWSEPMSYTIQEALAHGRPVVAYDVGAAREELLHGYCGFLVPPRNLQRLVYYVKELLTNEKMALETGNNARKFAERRFGLERTTQRYINLFNQLTKV